MNSEIAECRTMSTCESRAPVGIALDSSTRMTSYIPRQRDRREAVSDIVSALSRALDRRLDVSLMRGAFETALGRVIPLRSVRLREIGSRWVGRNDAPGAESVTLEVPGADPSSQGL